MTIHPPNADVCQIVTTSIFYFSFFILSISIFYNDYNVLDKPIQTQGNADWQGYDADSHRYSKLDDHEE